MQGGRLAAATTLALTLWVAASIVGASTAPAVKFKIAVSNIPKTAVPGSGASWSGQGYPGENYRDVICQWSPTRPSITLAEAATYRCNPNSSAPHFPVPARGSFVILSTPIDGQPYPPQNGGVSDNLRFVKREGSVIKVGPSLMEYGVYSGGAEPSFDESNGTLWIYDYRTERGPEVIRISTSTGALLQRTVMPPISRPIIGVNSLGFWLAQDYDSLYPNSHVKLGVWFAPVGASHGQLVKGTEGSAWAMLADGDAMEVFISPHWGTGSPTYQLWRFTPSG
jgi:hypothetical protein